MLAPLAFACITKSPTRVFRPGLMACGVSQYRQRRLQPAKRMKKHGSPAYVDSP
jgi:hypothetical protein